MNFTPTSKVLVQGILEPLGAAQVPLMKGYGTNVVAGVSAGHGGKTFLEIPVFDMVEQVVAVMGPIDTSILFVQPYDLLDAALEAIAAGIRQIILITEGMPPLDVVRLLRKAEITETLVIGPNCPGLIVPGQILLGTHPPEFYSPGSVGLISRSGTLTYEVALELTKAGLGQSIGVGIGGGTIIGSSFSQWLQILDEDEKTDVIVLVGEINGDAEEVAAQYIDETIDKPVIAYIAGYGFPKNLPANQAEIKRPDCPASNFQSLYRPMNLAPLPQKLAAFKQVNIPVAYHPSEIPVLVRKALKLSLYKE